MKKSLSYCSLVEIVNGFKGKSGKEYRLNEDKFRKLHMVSELVNKTADELECDQISIVINEETKDLKIEFDCISVYIDNITSASFFMLSQLVDNVVFSTTKEYDLRIDFIINELWES